LGKKTLEEKKSIVSAAFEAGREAMEKEKEKNYSRSRFWAFCKDGRGEL